MLAGSLLSEGSGEKDLFEDCLLSAGLPALFLLCMSMSVSKPTLSRRTPVLLEQGPP